MKQLLFLLILLPALAFGQKIETAGIGDKFTFTAEADYLVQRDTSASGVITVTFIPSAELKKDLESRLGSIDAELDRITTAIDADQARRKAANQERKELLDLIDKIGKLQAQKAAAPVGVNKTVTDPTPVIKPKGKRKKQ